MSRRRLIEYLIRSGRRRRRGSETTNVVVPVRQRWRHHQLNTAQRYKFSTLPSCRRTTTTDVYRQSSSTQINQQQLYSGIYRIWKSRSFPRQTLSLCDVRGMPIINSRDETNSRDYLIEDDDHLTRGQLIIVRYEKVCVSFIPTIRRRRRWIKIQFIRQFPTSPSPSAAAATPPPQIVGQY